MDNFHLSVITVAFCFNFPVSVGTKSQRSLLDGRHHFGCRWDGDFSVNCSFTGTSAVPKDLSQTVITADFSYNNIQTFTCADGRSEERMLKHLNLSNNLISELSLTTCRNLPLLETLNLDGNAIQALTLGLPTPQQDGKVDRLLPALKVLSVERNHLRRVPRGLGLLQSLQSLRLSSNGIRQVGLRDFQNCSQLKDIHLQNNKITEIHPDAFRDLHKLQVVDLRENALATPLPQILISLNFFRLEVGLSNNAGMFNCRLIAFKHLFNFLFDPTRKKWSISYNKPATNSQKPLLCLSSFHLNCSDGVLLKRAVIPTGRTSVLNCDLDNTRGNGVSWWTPKGRISKDNSLPHMTLDKMNNLVIHNAERTAEGLYLCTFNTTKKKYLMYSLQVKEKVSTFLVRKARDATAVFSQGGREQDLALAVSLSVLITFMCAFCLGAFARPYLVSLWRLVCRKKNSGPEHVYSNQGFSDETLSRESSASKPTNMPPDLFTSHETSSRKTRFFPTEASTSPENTIGMSTQAPNTKEEHQKQSNNENIVILGIKPSISNYENTNVGDTGLFSGRADYKSSNEVAPPETAKATPDSPKRKGMFSRNKPMGTTKFVPGRQSCDEQLGLNGDINTTGDMGEFVLPSSCKRDPNIENLHLPQTTENSPHTEYNRQMEHTNRKYTAADLFGDSSSDEGTPFTMSDCSSLSDLELEEPDVNDNLPVCQSSVEEADTKSGREKFPAPPESPAIAAELQSIGENEEENNAYCETTAHYGSDTILPKPASPYADKCHDHVNVSDSDTMSSSSQEVPDTFDKFTDAQPTVQSSDSRHNRSTDFGNTFLSLKCSPKYNTDTAPEGAAARLYQFPSEPEHSLSSTPPPQEEDAPEEDTEKNQGQGDVTFRRTRSSSGSSRSSTPPPQEEIAPEEDTERNPSEKNQGQGYVTFRRTRSSSEDSDFVFDPLDAGLNEIVRSPSPLHSSDQSSLHSLPEHTAEQHFTGSTEEDNLLPEGEEVNTTKACAEKTDNQVTADKSRDHVSVSDSDTMSSSSQEAHDTFDYWTDAEPTVQTPDSLHNQSTDFGNTFLALQHSPIYDTDTAPEGAAAQLYQFLSEPEPSLSSTPPPQEEDAREEDTERNPSEKNQGQGDVTFRRTRSSSEDSDFVFDPLDAGLNEIVRSPSPLHSSDQSSLHSLPEHTAEQHFTGSTEEDNLLPEGEEVNTTEACAEKTQTGFNEENCDGYTELQGTSKWSLPKAAPSSNLSTDLLHLHSSGKMQSVFNTEDPFRLDWRKEDAYSLSVTRGFFQESPRYSSGSFPQQARGTTISESTDPSKREDDATGTGLENSSATAANLHNSREKPGQKSQANLEQGQFFVKKKRAFDGFANVLQSRRTNFKS